MDHIRKILQFHLDASEKQLELMDKGYRINNLGDPSLGIPSTREELMDRIALLRERLERLPKN